MTRVLLADADLVVRAAIMLLLKHKLGILEFCEIGDAGQLGERLACFYTDVVLLDWDLPGLDVSQIRGEFQHLRKRPVLIVMSVQLENESLALASGADAFLNKRASGERVLNFLKTYLVEG